MARAVSTSWVFVFAVLAGVALAPGHAAEVSAAKKGGEEQSRPGARPAGGGRHQACDHAVGGKTGLHRARRRRASVRRAKRRAPGGRGLCLLRTRRRRSADAARRFRLQRRTRRRLRVAGARRAVALAASPRWRQLFAIDAAARRRQRRKLARLRRSRVRRSSRHGIQQVFERERRDRKSIFSRRRATSTRSPWSCANG